jgi:vesicle-associated membrane protein 7
LNERQLLRPILAARLNPINQPTPLICRVLSYLSLLSGCAVITGTQYPSRVAIQMLQELYTEFSAKHGDAAKSAAENSLSKKAKQVLQDTCTKFEDVNNVDKAAKVLGQVDVVKSTMQDNIAGMLKNTEKAESLAEKSDQLNEQASVFKKRSTDLRKQMQWKNLKMTLILGGVVVVILLAVLLPLIMRAKKAAE